ncbi:MAG: hypothetical protein JNJ88_07230 [Planctomycetes bacterium]|nr:hypothetical protein [Planctomycetota bacterium]
MNPNTYLLLIIAAILLVGGMLGALVVEVIDLLRHAHPHPQKVTHAGKSPSR